MRNWEGKDVVGSSCSFYERDKQKMAGAAVF